MVSKSMKMSQTSKKDEDFEKEVRNIKETLVFCNPNNFEQFFREFNEIIKQKLVNLSMEDLEVDVLCL